MHRFIHLTLFSALACCGSGAIAALPTKDAATAPDALAGADAAAADVATEAAAEASVGTPHSIVARIALAPDADGQHVTFATQNGSTVSLLKSDLVGKPVYWATTAGGDPITNGAPIDQSLSTLGTDLTSTFSTAPHYANGPWEVACVISVTGTPPPNIPAAGDLAAFDNSQPPPGDPPDTGVSVRVHVADADATVTLTNRYFIRFGTH